MQWDLGLQGLLVLLGMAAGFGAVAHIAAARTTTRWVGFIAAGTYFISGLLISEVWFGWATAAELQPNIDGLSFDESLLALVPGIAAILLVRAVRRRGPRDVNARPPTAHGVS